MENDDYHIPWQCKRVFLRTCPNVRHPAMKEIEPILRGALYAVSLPSMKAAEDLCENCSHFVPDSYIM